MAKTIKIKKPSKKTFNFDIYQLSIKNDEGGFSKFEKLIENELTSHTPVYHEDSPIFWENKFEKGKFLFGTFTYAQMVELPNAFDIVKQKTKKLPLKKDDGISHPTSFLFDSEIQMIIYESNKNGVSLGSFCEFFEKNYNIPYISTSIVIEPSEIDKLNKMKFIKRFQVKIAKVRNGKIFKVSKTKKGVGEIINVAKETNATVMDCTMLAGRKKKNSLDVPLIKTMLSELLTFKSNKEVSVLTITGKETAEENNKILNFIANKMSISFELEKQRFTNIDYKPKYELLEEKYLQIRASLLEVYKVVV